MFFSAVLQIELDEVEQVFFRQGKIATLDNLFDCIDLDIDFLFNCIAFFSRFFSFLFSPRLLKINNQVPNGIRLSK